MMARVACAIFFVCPGLVYGLFTGRLPAIKTGAGLDDAAIGILLLCIGLSCLAALILGAPCIRKFGCRCVLGSGTFIMFAAFLWASLLPARPLLYPLSILVGFGMGLADVAANSLGIEIERHDKTSCMSFLHASYSFGGIAGALAGAAFAAFSPSLFLNAITVIGLWSTLLPWAFCSLPQFASDRQPENSGRKRPPLYILLCGIMALLVFAAEGSAGEWGSLLLHDVKGADSATAALAFAIFSLATLVMRLTGDKLRNAVGDFLPLFGGSLLAFFGLLGVLISKTPIYCLAGYALMGLGLAPASPILFSRAGCVPGIDAAQASATVSILGYAGLLFFPPLLGFLAESYSLERALVAVLAVCLILAGGSFAICRPGSAGATVK